MKDHLRKMLDAIVSNDTEAAKASFHEYTVAKSKDVFEMAEVQAPEPVGGEGKKDPKNAHGKKEHNTTEKDEVKASGEAKSDPKAAKTSSEVTSTLSKAAKEDIKKSGEAAADPTKAKSSKSVTATVKTAATPDITAKKA